MDGRKSQEQYEKWAEDAERDSHPLAFAKGCLNGALMGAGVWAVILGGIIWLTN